MIRRSSRNLQCLKKGRRRKVAALLLFCCALWPAAGLALAPGSGADARRGGAGAGDGAVLSGAVFGAAPAPRADLAEAPCEIREEITRKGRERLWLAARLRADGGLVTRPVSWRVRKVGPLAGTPGSVVASSREPVAEYPLTAGEYDVEVRYGYRRVHRRITVRPGRFVAVTFILQVGGLRALSVLEHIGAPPRIRVRHAVYALSGPGRARLVATSETPGAILRLGQGNYRVEARFLPGNARAEARVRIRPGILSSLQITARAGLLRIEAADDAPWRLRDEAGPWRTSGQGSALLVLAPGAYVLSGASGPARHFTIAAGQRRTLRAAAR